MARSSSSTSGTSQPAQRAAAASAWLELTSSAFELELEATLANGQCFGWTNRGASWLGVIGEHVIELKKTATAQSGGVELRCVTGPTSSEIVAACRDYFQLDTPLKPLYDAWSLADTRLSAIAECLPGMRVLRQDPLECLFGFICSSNNNIARITKMVGFLRQRYGRQLYATEDGLALHAFPTIEALAACNETELRDAGFGYRAKFIVQASQQVLERGGVPWLLGLRRQSLGEAVDALMGLTGVGRKVAHCVALFSLDQPHAIPVDTHVWQIAKRDYRVVSRDVKTLTPDIFQNINKFFLEKHGSHCGWAHCLLFAAELPLFKRLLLEARSHAKDAKANDDVKREPTEPEIPVKREIAAEEATPTKSDAAAKRKANEVDAATKRKPAKSGAATKRKAAKSGKSDAGTTSDTTTKSDTATKRKASEPVTTRKRHRKKKTQALGE